MGDLIGPKYDLIGPKYYADPYYQSQAYREKLAAAQEIEATRQALIRGEATAQTLAYARFLSAVENDATLSRGAFKRFIHSDDEVARDWPQLAPMITERDA